MKKASSTPWQSRPQRFFWWLCAVCLSVYLAYAAYLSQSAVLTSTVATISALLWFVVIAAGTFTFLQRFSTLTWKTRASTERKKLDLRVFAAGFGVSLAILAIFLMADYPGGVTVDSAVQWTQAQTHQYSNWHPVFHTLLLQLGAALYNSHAFVVALQCGAFSLAMGYLIATLHAWGIRALWLLMVEAVLVASPIVGNTMMYLWKDNAMTMGVAVLFAQCVNLYFSRGTWLEKRQNALAFGLALAFTTLVRHNAILFTLPLLATAALCYRKQLRGTIVAATALVVTLALVWGPLYSALNVKYPNNKLEESIGVPMTIVCNVRKQNPDALDAETRAFTDRMGDAAAWDAYRLDTYNSIKFGKTREAVSRSTLAEVLGMAVRTAQADPRGAFEAVNGVTDLVWGLNNEGAANVNVRNSGDLPTVVRQSGRMNQLGNALKTLLTAPLSLDVLGWYLGNLGVSFAAMLILAIRAIRRSGASALLLCLPTLLYNLATMCVLCGNDARFFSYSPLLCTMALFVLPRDLPESIQ